MDREHLVHNDSPATAPAGRFLKPHSISQRLTLILTINVVLVATLVTAFIYYFVVRNEKSELNAKADENLVHLTGVLAVPMWDMNEPVVRMIGESIFQDKLVVSLVITDQSGKALFSKEKDHGPDLINRSDTIFYKDNDIGRVSFSITESHYQKNRRNLLVQFFIITFLILISILFVTGLFIGIFIKNPLNRINEILDAYARGQYDFDIGELPFLEFQTLGNVLSLMGSKINEQIVELRSAERSVRKANFELEKHRDQLEDIVKERTVELSEAKEEAETANKSKSEFLARMSHEIRTPLNAVTGLTNIVLKSDMTPEQRDYLNKVQLAGNNLLVVINDILDFSKVEAGRLELEQHHFELDLVLAQLADLFSDQVAQKDLELILVVDSQVPRQVEGDAGRLTQVLTNLVANAIKFTDSGEVVVRVEIIGQADLNAGWADLKFSVSDTGTGIAADLLPSLFEPFTQAGSYLTRKYEGTGLGLAICRRLVELMGGRIRAESTPGKGSNFFFTVRLKTRKQDKPVFNLPADLRGLKVLVVDDSASARHVMVDLLESFTIHAVAVNSGEKAIEALHRVNQKDPFQLVFLDWKMPGMDGIETAKRIRRVERQEPEFTNWELPIPIVIMVTAFGHEMVQKDMDAAVVDTTLLKPVHPSLLFNTIMALLGQAEAAVRSRRPEQTEQPIHHLLGRRVLVVEDSELNREVASSLLEVAGLKVETAKNGRVAVNKVTGSPIGYYDAVLMDIQMPVMDGYEATQNIRAYEKQHGPTAEQTSADPDLSGGVVNTPIIALTAHALKGEKEKCLAADMDDYLAKPIDEQEMYRVLLKWIAYAEVEDNVHWRKK